MSAWCTVHGVRCTVYGVRCTVHSARCTVHGGCPTYRVVEASGRVDGAALLPLSHHRRHVLDPVRHFGHEDS